MDTKRWDCFRWQMADKYFLRIKSANLIHMWRHFVLYPTEMLLCGVVCAISAGKFAELMSKIQNMHTNDPSELFPLGRVNTNREYKCAPDESPDSGE